MTLAAPPLPTLVLVDNGDGTATATITGTLGTATNSIYAQPANGTIRTPAWVLQASRQGNGVVTFTITPGMYWCQLQSTSTKPARAIIAPLVFFGVAGNTYTSTHEQCVAAIRARIQGMTFAGTAASPAGIDPVNGILDGLVPIDQFQGFPALMISVEGESESIQGGVNSADDFGFPVRIAIVDQMDMVTMRDGSARRPKYTKWREQLCRAFEKQRLGGVPNIFDSAVSPGPIVDPRMAQLAYFVSGLTCRFKDRLSHGLTGNTLNLPVPGLPTNLAVGSPTTTTLTLTWTLADNLATSINVYRNGDLVTTLANGEATTYTDSSLFPGNTYSYQIQTVNTAGASALTGVVSGSTTSTYNDTLITIPGGYASAGRTAIVHVPSGASTPAPVVLIFHGGGSSAAGARYQTGFNVTSDANGFIAVYPNGTGTNPGQLSWNAVTCCPPATTQNVNDVQFVQDLITYLGTLYTIDTTKVYATGFSNGAMLCHLLGRRLAGTIAAIAPVSGDINGYTPTPSQGVRVLDIQGGADGYCPAPGGIGQYDKTGCVHQPFRKSDITNPQQFTNAGVDQWVQWNGASTTPTAIALADGTQFTYAGTSPVVAVFFPLGGHQWPGGAYAPNLVNQTQITSWNASTHIWNFFSTGVP